MPGAEEGLRGMLFYVERDPRSVAGPGSPPARPASVERISENER